MTCKTASKHLNWTESILQANDEAAELLTDASLIPWLKLFWLIHCCHSPLFSAPIGQWCLMRASHWSTFTVYQLILGDQLIPAVNGLWLRTALSTWDKSTVSSLTLTGPTSPDQISPGPAVDTEWPLEHSRLHHSPAQTSELLLENKKITKVKVFIDSSVCKSSTGLFLFQLLNKEKGELNHCWHFI